MTAQVQSMPSFSSDFGAVRTQFTQLSTAGGSSSGRDIMDPNSAASTDGMPTSPTDESRGRRRVRDGANPDDGDMSGGNEGADGVGNSKKRRRSRKGLDKKFECPHEDCGKSYSRAEHLYRHQLNHNPKQIYHCDFPDCHRSFVRQDLCARHKERHTARGSQLLRKENFMQNLNPIVTAAMAAQAKKQQHSPTISGTPTSYPSGAPHAQTVADRGYPMQSPVTASHPGSTLMDATLPSSGTEPGGLQRSNTLSFTSSGPGYVKHEGFNKPYSPYAQAAGGNPQQYNRPTHPSQSPSGFQHTTSFPTLTQLPQPAYSTIPQASSSESAAYTSSAAPDVTATMNAVTDTFMGDNMTPTTFAMPMFGGEGYSRSPFAMADDFTAWLFNDQNFGPSASPMPGFQPGNNAVGNTSFGMQQPYFGQETMFNGPMQQTAMPPQGHQMAVSNLIDTNMQQMALSEERRQEILDLIDTRFNDTSHAPVRKREDLLDGNRDNDRHVLSLNMMQTYIASFWLHFHPQMPLLHKPTFQANNSPPLLLLVIITLGASCLEKTYGYEVTQNGADLSAFLAWHLRWEIFMDADFRPPAKLWVFQALLLLEIFEKMYSTRPLHERAHIHHATTLTLMRRGSSLIGRSSMDSPPSGADSHGTGSRHGSINGASHSSSSNQFTADEWWNQWITNEATRRASFAAFVMDSIHATMFGHSAVMVAHEMRLPLPCDEALWNATSSAEVGRVEQSLHQNGIKPTTFLDGLKKTLNGQPVRTNSFGRTILMAGLLSVSWHMNQRDLQVSSLGVSQALGGRDKWRGSLTRAFDFWKIDLDESYAKANEGQQYPYYSSKAPDDENIFESRTVLHHLAHMAMHVDIVDCQIFAGASRLLGRSITPQDYAGAQRRMKEGWAPTARARDATFYALRFLSQVLVPDEATATGASGGLAKPEFLYSARDDYLLNRPWVLYFATLIVWSYGYALDGPISPMYKLASHDEVVNDMQGFLRRVGGVRAPDDLARMQNRNACLGLLVLMRDTFGRTRWELLHEASKLLTKCIDMLSAAAPVAGAQGAVQA